MSVVELIYRLGADSSRFSSELKGAERNVQRFQRRAESNVRKLGKAFLTLGGLAGGALAGLVKQAIDTGAELSVMSDRTGVAVEELSALGWAAEQAGVAEGQLERGLIRFNRTMGEVERGTGRAAEMARRLGISLHDTNGSLRPQGELLGEIAEAVANARDSYEEAAIASEFFGREAGPKLLPLLKEGEGGIEELKDEAERMGIVFSDHAARAARQLQDDVNRLRKRTHAYAITVASNVLPVLNQYVTDMLDSADATEKNADEVSRAARITAGLLKAVEGVRVSFVIVGTTLGVVGASLTTMVTGAIDDLKRLGAGVGNLVRAIVSRDVSAIGSAWNGLTTTMEENDERFVAEQKALWGSYAEDIEKIVMESGRRMAELDAAAAGTAITPGEDDDGDEGGRDLVDFGFDAAVDEAEEELKRLQGIVARELSALETPAQEFKRRMDDLNSALAEGLLNPRAFEAIRSELIQTLDPYGDLARQAEETSRLMAEADWMQGLKRQAREVIAEINGIDLATVAHLESLQELRDEGLITWGEYEMAVQGVVGAVESAEEDTNELIGLTQDVASTFASGLIDFVIDPFNSSVEEMATNFIRQTTRMVLETAAQRAILAAFGGDVGSPGFAGGGVVQAFAAGGFVSGPGTATSDSIPAMLSDGEYVLNARTTRRLGVSRLDAINSGNAQGFADGGLVSRSGGGSGGDMGGMEVIVVNNLEEAQQKYLNSRAGRRKIVQIQYEEGERSRR